MKLWKIDGWMVLYFRPISHRNIMDLMGANVLSVVSQGREDNDKAG